MKIRQPFIIDNKFKCSDCKIKTKWKGYIIGFDWAFIHPLDIFKYEFICNNCGIKLSERSNNDK